MPDETDPAERALLLAFLKDRDVACPLCQYNLRNLSISTCPECGKTIELAVRARDVPVQLWATFTVALSLPAGVGILFLWLIIRDGFPDRGDMNPFLLLAFIFMIPLAITALAMRQKFLRLAREVQFRLAALAVCSIVVLFYVMMKELR